MKAYLFISLALLLLGASGCGGPRNAYFDRDFESGSRHGDPAVFDSGYHNYHQKHGFDVFRSFGSFHDGYFY